MNLGIWATDTGIKLTKQLAAARTRQRQRKQPSNASTTTAWNLQLCRYSSLTHILNRNRGLNTLSWVQASTSADLDMIPGLLYLICFHNSVVLHPKPLKLEITNLLVNLLRVFEEP